MALYIGCLFLETFRFVRLVITSHFAHFYIPRLKVNYYIKMVTISCITNLEITISLIFFNNVFLSKGYMFINF